MKKNLTERVISVVDKVVEEQNRARDVLEKDIEGTHNAIHQLSAALGKSPPDLSVFSDMSLKLILRNYQVQLEKVQREKDLVMKELRAEWEKLQNLWDQLGSPYNPEEYNAQLNRFDQEGDFDTIDENKLTAATLKRYHMVVAHWTKERNTRAATIAEFEQMIQQLETQLGEDAYRADQGMAVCSYERINALKRRVEKLTKVRLERQQLQETARQEIVALYDLLKVPLAERIEILEGDLTRKTMDTCDRERNRLGQLKESKMSQLVDSVTRELQDLYARLGLGEGRIPELSASNKGEALFKALQEELVVMQGVMASCQSITDLIPTREKLRALHAQVLAMQQDPSRLLSRQGGQNLLKEQKMEHKVKTELPPLERQIKGLISQWEKTYKRDFVYNGERYLDVIERDQRDDSRSADERKQRLADRKMRDLDASSVFERSLVAEAVSVRPALKTQARTRDVQSAQPQARTAPRIAPGAGTPSNVPVRPNPVVAVSRAPAKTPGAGKTAPTPAPAPETTPVARSATGKYAKVRSKIDTGLNLKPITNNMKL